MTHTWELYLRYNQCPKCGRIIECRKDVKEQKCPSCNHLFTVEKKKSTKPEFDWS